MSRNRNQNHQQQNHQRRCGFNNEPDRSPIVLLGGAVPQTIIPVTREEYTELIRRSVTLDLVTCAINKKDTYMDVRPLQKLLGIIDSKKEDDE